MADETKTFTQEELNSIVAERLMRERDKYKDYDTLKEKVGELDTLKSQFEAVQNELTGIKTESIKSKILDEVGLPKELATRLNGSTEAEMKADAEELKKMLGVTKQIGTPTNPANSTNLAKTFTKAEISKMTPDEINSNWNVIQEQMAKGLLK